MEETFAFRAEMTMLKRDDMKSTADLLLDLSHPVVDLIDPERIGALGHSLGGSAALEWCQSDPRCKAAVNLDGAIWTEVGETDLTKPAMVIAAEHPEMLALPEDLVAAGAFPTVEWCVRERQLPVRRLAASRRRRRIAVDDRGRLPRQLLRHPIRGDAGRFSMAESPWVRPTGRDVATDE
jgi:pimeloyl-ACP methyl ester carboxylesterase